MNMEQLDDAIIAAFIHAEDQYLGCKHLGAWMPTLERACPFWCFWNSRDALCVECEGFKRQVLGHVHSIIDENTNINGVRPSAGDPPERQG